MLVVRLTIIQPTLSKTERWVKRFDRWTEDFYHLNYVFPNFTYCINCDLFTGHGAIKSYTVCEIFSLCKRIYSRQELRPTMTQFCRWGGILHFHFSLHEWLQHITMLSGCTGFLSVLKLCIKLHLADSLYSFILLYTHTQDIFIIFIFSFSSQISSFNS